MLANNYMPLLNAIENRSDYYKDYVCENGKSIFAMKLGVTITKLI